VLEGVQAVRDQRGHVVVLRNHPEYATGLLRVLLVLASFEDRSA
jgi:hypothetical protein